MNMKMILAMSPERLMTIRHSRVRNWGVIKKSKKRLISRRSVKTEYIFSHVFMKASSYAGWRKKSLRKTLLHPSICRSSCV